MIHVFHEVIESNSDGATIGANVRGRIILHTNTPKRTNQVVLSSSIDRNWDNTDIPCIQGRVSFKQLQPIIPTVDEVARQAVDLIVATYGYQHSRTMRTSIYVTHFPSPR
jgi:hypothetical protein